MKIANIEQRNSSCFMKDLRNFNESLGKDMTYDNIKSHQKPGFHPLFRRNIFRKTTKGGGRSKIDPFPSRLRVNVPPSQDNLKTNLDDLDVGKLKSIPVKKYSSW